jgi:N-acetylneuraminate lyase
MNRKTGVSARVPDGSVFKDMAGAYVALMTPFTKKDTVNVAVLEQQVDYYAACGIRGLYVTGGTGEGLLLTLAERKHVLETVVRANAGRMRIIAHIGCINTNDAVTLARHAEKTGADWISSVAPVYFGQTFAAAHRHYTKIAATTGLPFLIYATAGTALDPERDARLFDIPNVMGMKYTGIDFYALQRLIWRLAHPAIFFAGMDPLFVPAFASGCIAGCIGTTQNVVPRHFTRMFDAMTQGDFASAIRLQAEANRVLELLTESENWSHRKAMVRFIGLDVGAARPPYELLTDAQYEALAARMREQGIVRENDALKGQK